MPSIDPANDSAGIPLPACRIVAIGSADGGLIALTTFFDRLLARWLAVRDFKTTVLLTSGYHAPSRQEAQASDPAAIAVLAKPYTLTQLGQAVHAALTDELAHAGRIDPSQYVSPSTGAQ